MFSSFPIASLSEGRFYRHRLWRESDDKNAEGWHAAGVTEGVKRAIPYSLKNLGYFSFWFSSISATTLSA